LPFYHLFTIIKVKKITFYLLGASILFGCELVAAGDREWPEIYHDNVGGYKVCVCFGRESCMGDRTGTLAVSKL
jgi:hypothetical protein